MKAKFVVFKVVKVAAAIVFFGALFGFGTMHLWNWLVPDLFHGPVISFWQAVGLIVLSKIMFGGFHGRGGKWGGRHKMREQWKMKMEERMSTMTEEEIEKWKNKFGNKW